MNKIDWDKLSDEKFDEEIRANPSQALANPEALARMSKVQIGWIAKSVPMRALEFAADRLSDAQFRKAAAIYPATAYRFAPERMKALGLL